MARDELHGPDERDRDLLDGSWDARRRPPRNWRNVGLAFSILILAGLLLPLFRFAL